MAVRRPSGVRARRAAPPRRRASASQSRRLARARQSTGGESARCAREARTTHLFKHRQHLARGALPPVGLRQCVFERAGRCSVLGLELWRVRCGQCSARASAHLGELRLERCHVFALRCDRACRDGRLDVEVRPVPRQRVPSRAYRCCSPPHVLCLLCARHHPVLQPLIRLFDELLQLQQPWLQLVLGGDERRGLLRSVSVCTALPQTRHAPGCVP